ncbi:MAG: GtrA-like protein [Alphaproteobacteria bacterium ADurb.Bin100]|nr:MAG: GtrA-like protein [Alphaproteobacteria bacterium ADurb.Bin100]
MVPIRFIAFSLVGGLGLVVHLIVLAGMFKGLGTSFLWAQSGATLVAMTSNYVMNNVLTYRDMRLRGWSFVRGWLSFVVACSVGALANVGIADYLFHKDSFWITSAIAGVLVGAVWNYAVTAVYTWKTPKAG